MDVRREICASGSGAGGVRRELAAPYRAFVAYERPDPVTRPLPQHRVSIFAARYEHVRVVVLEGREGEVRDGSRMAGGHERDGFGRDERHLCWGEEQREEVGIRS